MSGDLQTTAAVAGTTRQRFAAPRGGAQVGASAHLESICPADGAGAKPAGPAGFHESPADRCKAAPREKEIAL